MFTLALSAVFATACGEGFPVDPMGPETIGDAFLFLAYSEELQRRFNPDPGGMDYRLEDIATRHTTFDRVGLQVDMIDAESEPVADARVFAGTAQGWSDRIPLAVTWSEGILYSAYVEVPHGGTYVQLRLRSPEPEMVSAIRLMGFTFEIEQPELDD